MSLTYFRSNNNDITPVTFWSNVSNIMHYLNKATKHKLTEKTEKKKKKESSVLCVTTRRWTKQSSYTAVFRWDDELGDLSSMDAENVLHLSSENVPDDDGEVHSSGHKRALVIARGDLVRIQDARHLVPVASQGTMGRPACRMDRHITQTGRLRMVTPLTGDLISVFDRS